MNKKLSLRTAVALLAVAMTLTACGGRSTSNYMRNDSASSSALGGVYITDSYEFNPNTLDMEEYARDISLPTLPQDGRKRVQHVDLSLETLEFDTALTQLEELITKSGGYLANQLVDGQSIYTQKEYYHRSATLNARIPVEKMEETVKAASKLCHVTYTSRSVDDITDQYTDTETRLSTLRLQEQRLLELLAKADTVEDMLTIESRLAEVRYAIESLSGQKVKMDNQVAYAYLNLSLTEVVEYQELQQEPATFGDRLAASLRRSGKNITNTFQNLLFFLIEEGPLLIIYGGIILLIVWAVGKVRGAWSKKFPNRPKQPHYGPTPGSWGSTPWQQGAPVAPQPPVPEEQPIPSQELGEDDTDTIIPEEPSGPIEE